MAEAHLDLFSIQLLPIVNWILTVLPYEDFYIVIKDLKQNISFEWWDVLKTAAITFQGYLSKGQHNVQPHMWNMKWLTTFPRGHNVMADQCMPMFSLPFHYIVLFYLIWRILTHGLLFTTYLISSHNAKTNICNFASLCKYIVLYIICEQHFCLLKMYYYALVKTCEYLCVNHIKCLSHFTTPFTHVFCWYLSHAVIWACWCHAKI